MEAMIEQLLSLQRSLDDHTGQEGSSCPVCGITPYELAQILPELIARAIENSKEEEK